jgi:hypothetical protein
MYTSIAWLHVFIAKRINMHVSLNKDRAYVYFYPLVAWFKKH